MTTQEFYQSALLSFGQDSNNARFSDDFFRSLEFAQQDFCSRRSWGFLRSAGTVTTTANVRIADLPADFRMLFEGRGSIRYIGSGEAEHGELTLIDEQQYWQSYFDENEKGKPTYCWIFGTTISFSPIPDDAYELSIIYYKQPHAITDAQSVITIPTEYHEALQHMVRRRLQTLGYSAVMEISISDSEINRLLSQYARDDVRRYGGLKINLPPSRYTISAV